MSESPTRFISEHAPVIVDAVSAIPGVAWLDGGTFGELSTYMPQQIVRGVTEDTKTGHIKIGIVAEWPANLPQLAAAVRQVVAATATNPVDVYINDLQLPGEEDAPVSAPAATAAAPKKASATPKNSR